MEVSYAEIDRLPKKLLLIVRFSFEEKGDQLIGCTCFSLITRQSKKGCSC